MVYTYIKELPINWFFKPSIMMNNMFLDKKILSEAQMLLEKCAQENVVSIQRCLFFSIEFAK